MSGWVFLGCTSTKQGNKVSCLRTQRSNELNHIADLAQKPMFLVSDSLGAIVCDCGVSRHIDTVIRTRDKVMTLWRKLPL